MKTLMCILVDESGSMNQFADEVMDGYNEFLEEQLRIKDETYLYLFKFNSHVYTTHTHLPLQYVPKLDANSYSPNGGTALNDAIARGIEALDSDSNNADRMILVIITDGMENSSVHTDEAKVRQLIAECHTKGNWSFVYIGECSKHFAEKMGIPANNVIDFKHGKEKMKANFAAASTACTNLRSNKLRACDALLMNNV